MKPFRLFGMTFKSKSKAYLFFLKVEVCFILALIAFAFFIYHRVGIVSWPLIAAIIFNCIGPIDKANIYHKAKRTEMVDCLLSEPDAEEKK